MMAWILLLNIPVDGNLLFLAVMLLVLLIFVVGVILTEQSLYVLLEMLLSFGLILIIPSLFFNFGIEWLMAPFATWIWRVVFIVIELVIFAIKVLLTYNEGWKTLKEGT
ncbi:MAG: hypothetical protein ACXQS8_09255, partial [Candidatus Helarchaeales archaeon]